MPISITNNLQAGQLDIIDKVKIVTVVESAKVKIVTVAGHAKVKTVTGS